jgi:hypothetical protein
MTEDDQIQSFPDITPSKIIRSEVQDIEEFDIRTEEDFQRLIQQMFEYPERHFYYFQGKDAPKNQFMIDKDRQGYISFAETEFFYYRRPNSERSYIHLERHGGKYKRDWEREIVEKGPMFMRTHAPLN